MISDRIGSSFESFLEEEGIRDEVDAVARERVRASSPEPEPLDDRDFDAFLTFAERDMARHPGSIQPISANLLARAERLVEGVEIDIDEKVD